MSENNNVSKMPVLFIGHGSPMNLIEENPWTKDWEELANLTPRPKAILTGIRPAVLYKVMKNRA